MPAGGAEEQELRKFTEPTLGFLDHFATPAVVMASNAPSSTVPPELHAGSPLGGVWPPVRTVLA